MPTGRFAYRAPMIRLSILYPAGEGTTFDHDYYRDTHIPLVEEIWAPQSITVDKGTDGPYVAAVHCTFESADAMGAAMGSERTGELLIDVANYTNAQPVMQTSEVVR
jgi:uncharacterized protein (TIGR02118 family)